MGHGGLVLILEMTHLCGLYDLCREVSTNKQALREVCS